MTSAPTAWDRARLALSLLAIDPDGLGGIWMRARAGVSRDRFVAALASAFPKTDIHRLHPAISDDQLFGGVDLTATLDAGQTVMSRGILNDDGSVLLLTMAERSEEDFAAKICHALDRRSQIVIALDEGLEEEAVPGRLSSRLAFHIDFDGLTHRDCLAFEVDADALEIAQRNLARIAIPAEMITDTTTVAARLGIADPRAALFTLRAARALTALKRGDVITNETLADVMQFVLGPRAMQWPEAAEEPETQADQQPQEETETESNLPENEILPLQDVYLDTIAASLPADVLDRLKSRQQTAGRATGSGAGEKRKGNRRGRPKPSRRGRLGSAARVDLVATLRAAAPWQKMRRDAPFAPDKAVHVRASDIRLKQFEDHSDRLLIFVVDASGSAALARLAEAKGAIELLLAEAYARRDHVALIAFRGESADLMLPPTRSLVQTKRRLASLPGGGGTPLAAGLEAALSLAASTKSKGLTPTIALLTDGRANIALDGNANRTEAVEDAQKMAQLIRAKQTPALVIDTGMRPTASLKDLAQDLDATYLPLPRADAHRVSQAVEAVLE